MKRMLLVLVAGLASGVLAHVAWFGAGRTNAGENLDSQLAWMQHTLQLSPEQFARIKALHEQSSPRLMALAARVARMQNEFAAFESERRTTGQVDFLDFARFVEQRHAAYRECAESTRKLILAASEIMSPEQRETYLTLLNPALKTLGPGSMN
jgi:hypothetical protein